MFSYRKCKKLDIAAAYFSISGWEKIVEELERFFKKGNPARFLLGVHPSSGAKALLYRIREFQQKLGKDSLGVKFIPPRSDGRDFHAKVYIAKKGDCSELVVGSSNLTHGGLISNLEFNYRERCNTDDPKFIGIQQWFNNLYKNEAVEYHWETLEELFSLPPASKEKTTPRISIGNIDYFHHFLAIQLKYLTVPLGGRVNPFFFQMKNVQDMIQEYEDRLAGRRGKLIAHEVGLGKTIVAGLTLKEVIERKTTPRILILCPASLTEQWQQEMWDKIGEEFPIITSDKINESGINIFREERQAIVSIDLFKNQVMTKNPDPATARQEKYLLDSDWSEDLRYDFVVLDESHYVKNHTSKRYKAVFQLVKQLKKPDGYIALLSATPIQNKEEELYYQLFLTYPELLKDEQGKINPPTSADFRSLQDLRDDLRRDAIDRKLRSDEDIQDLFKERKTPEDVRREMTANETALYQKLARFLGKECEFYTIMSTAGSHQYMQRIVPFIKITYLREFCSSADAIYEALVGQEELIDGQWELQTKWEQGDVSQPLANKMALKGRILTALHNRAISYGESSEEQIQILKDENYDLFEQLEESEEGELQLELSEEQLDGLRNDLETINEIAEEIQNIKPFAKERKITDDINEILEQELRKIVIFVAYLPTGKIIQDKLTSVGIKADFYHGGLDEGQRNNLIDCFWNEDQNDDDRLDVLIATDAGGVGLNLQVANHVINYDLSWNPMVVEQRIGRVHRIGQTKDVFVRNLVAQTSDSGEGESISVEEQMYQTLSEKIDLIKAQDIDLSDEVIADSLVQDSELTEATLRYQANEISKEDYEKIIEDVVEKQSDKLEELQQLSELKTLESVTDEEERKRAEQQGILFDKYLQEVLEDICESYATEVEERSDGTLKIRVDSSLSDRQLVDENWLTTDRELAEKRRELKFFGLRHPWLQSYIEELKSSEKSIKVRRNITQRDLENFNETFDKINVESVSEALQSEGVIHQFNFLLTHTIQAGDKPEETHETLYSIAGAENINTHDEVYNGKLNFIQGTETQFEQEIPVNMVEQARSQAGQYLDEQIDTINNDNRKDATMRMQFRLNQKMSEIQNKREQMEALAESIIPRLKRGEEDTNYPSVESAEERLRELEQEVGALSHEFDRLRSEQQERVNQALQFEVEREEPQLLSYCQYVYEGN